MDSNPDKIKALYDAASQKYDLGSYDEFAQKLQDPSKRKAFYDTASKDFDLGDFSTFENKVVKKKAKRQATFSRRFKINLGKALSNLRTQFRLQQVPIRTK